MKRLALAALLALPGTANAASCTGPVCNFATLKPWFDRISDKAWFKASARAAHILQLGDSLTAGDAMTGGWRALLQARWSKVFRSDEGVGGRGVLPLGRPYDGYIAKGVTVTMSDGWQVATTFGEGSATPRPPLGLSSYSLTPTRPGASVTLAADPGMAFNRFTLCGLAGPRAGQVVVRFYDEYGYGDETFDFARKAAAPLCLESPDIRTTNGFPPMSKVELTVPGAPVTLTSWGFFSLGGVALSNLGVVGSQLQHFARTDDAVLAEELRVYQPDLIVLAFGTNEGFAPAFDAAGYEATLRGQIARLQRLVPKIPILLLGPPDALTRREDLREGAANCPTLPGVAPLFAPPRLDYVRAVQRKVAGDLDLAWWDWQARMGGPCSAQGWAMLGLMRTDYVHFRSAGGERIARLLQDDLDRAARETR